MKTSTKVILGTMAVAAAGGVAWWLVASNQPKPITPPPDEKPEDKPEEKPPEDQPADEPAPGPKPVNDPLGGTGIYTPTTPGLLGVLSDWKSSGTWCQKPIIPKGTTDYSGQVMKAEGKGLVWGWQRPFPQSDSNKPAKTFGKRFIVTLVSTTVSPMGWKGDEVEQAKKLGKQVFGVSGPSNPGTLVEVLKAFATTGIVGYPRVVPSLGSQDLLSPGVDPRQTLRDALNAWKAMGFKTIVPILTVINNAATKAMIDECNRLGTPFMLTKLQDLGTHNITCDALEG